jgi:hypothetical protein
VHCRVSIRQPTFADSPLARALLTPFLCFIFPRVAATDPRFLYSPHILLLHSPIKNFYRRKPRCNRIARHPCCPPAERLTPSDRVSSVNPLSLVFNPLQAPAQLDLVTPGTRLPLGFPSSSSSAWIGPRNCGRRSQAFPSATRTLPINSA